MELILNIVKEVCPAYAGCMEKCKNKEEKSASEEEEEEKKKEEKKRKGKKSG